MASENREEEVVKMKVKRTAVGGLQWFSGDREVIFGLLLFKQDQGRKEAKIHLKAPQKLMGCQGLPRCVNNRLTGPLTPTPIW